MRCTHGDSWANVDTFCVKCWEARGRALTEAREIILAFLDDGSVMAAASPELLAWAHRALGAGV